MHPDAVADLSALVERYTAEHHVPSSVWGVVRDGALVASGATGTLDDGRAPTASTVYRIASMTKSFTAAVVLSLRDDGVVRLDEPITTYAPELEPVAGGGGRGAGDDRDGDRPPMTLAHLMSMSAGLPTDDPWADRHLDISDDELDALVRRRTWFAVPTGTAFEYSNLGYALVGRVVQRVTGERVQDLVTERLLRPLGMTLTGWLAPEHDDWARPYRWTDGAHERELDPVGDGALAPMGGLWSTVEDLARWTAWLDDAFPARGGPDEGPLRRASRRELQQVHRYSGHRAVAGREDPQGYGYGIGLRDDRVLGIVAGHAGGLPGYGSNMRWLPGRGVSAIAVGNVTYAPMTELTLLLLDRLHALGELPPPTVPVVPELERACRALVALLTRWDDAAAAELFTDNVALDEPLARRRADAAQRLGPALERVEISRITAVHAARADVHLSTPTGRWVLEVELSPLLPVRISWYELRAEPADAAHAADAADAAVGG